LIRLGPAGTIAHVGTRKILAETRVIQAEIRDLRAETHALRAVMREEFRQRDPIFKQMVAALLEGRDEQRAMNRRIELLIEHMEDQREESRAQRAALLALIDEIRNGGLGPAPAS
jgi:hypothetical protein